MKISLFLIVLVSVFAALSSLANVDQACVKSVRSEVPFPSQLQATVDCQNVSMSCVRLHQQRYPFPKTKEVLSDCRYRRSLVCEDVLKRNYSHKGPIWVMNKCSNVDMACVKGVLQDDSRLSFESVIGMNICKLTEVL